MNTQPHKNEAKGDPRCPTCGNGPTYHNCADGFHVGYINKSSPPPSGTNTPDTDSAMFCIGCGADGNGTPQDVVDAALSRHLESQRSHWRGLCGLKDADIQRLTAERDQMRRERDEMRNKSGLWWASKQAETAKECDSLRTTLADTQRQLSEARKDRERLDWLQQNGQSFSAGYGREQAEETLLFYVGYGWHEHIRAAIDAARAAQPAQSE